MRQIQIVFFLSFVLSYSCNQKNQHTIIAFGSCSHEFDSLQMWDNVITHMPTAWIWMGDNIYGDTENMEVMQAKYDMQKQRPSYQKLQKSMKIYGIWDDHDFGINDGGKEYAMKDESKKLMLDFLDVPHDAEVRHRQGAYQAHTIIDKGLSIKLILLDTRYFRDSLEINPSAPPLYKQNTEGTILGEEQWLWLENELQNSEADIHLIGASYQLIPNDHGWEKWGNFPLERDRFFDLIVKTKPARPIILSGDRHIAEFSKINLKGLDYPLYEFTSSGLTHTWGEERAEPNKNRIDEMIIRKNFGIIFIDHNDKKIHIKLMAYGSQNELLGEVIADF